MLGRLYARGGRTGDALDEFKVAIRCRETPAARLGLAMAYLDSGDAVAARREAARALALDPNSSEAKALLKKIRWWRHANIAAAAWLSQASARFN